MAQVITDFTEVLREPLVLASDTKLRGGRIKLSDEYRYEANTDGLGVVRNEPGAKNIEVENLTLEGPSFEWWQAHAKPEPEWFWPFRGISFVDVSGPALLSHIKVTRMAAEGIYLRDYANLSLYDCASESCGIGLAIDWPRAIGNQQLLVDRLDVSDTQGVGPYGMGSSLKFPGRRTGGNFVQGIGMTRATFSNVRATGEGKGVKFWGSKYLNLSHLEVPQLWLGGMLPEKSDCVGWQGPSASVAYVLRDSLIGGGIWGFSAEQSSGPIPLFLSGSCKLLVEDTTILAPRPGLLEQSEGVYPGWRYEVIKAHHGFRANLGRGVRLLDLHGDAPEPTWISAVDGAVVTEGADLRRERSVPHWGNA